LIYYLISKLVRKNSRSIRYPDGYIKEQIIKWLRNGPLRFSDLKNSLRISKPVLSEHLKKLEKKEIIFFQRRGREVYYSLMAKAWESPEIRVLSFTSLIHTFIKSSLTDWGKDDKKLHEVSEKDLLRELARKISAAILFTQIKSAETNQDFTRSLSRFATDNTLIKRRIIYPDFDEKISNKPLMQFGNLKSKINRLYHALRELYPQEMKVIEQVYKNPRIIKDPLTNKIQIEYQKPPKIYKPKINEEMVKIFRKS